MCMTNRDRFPENNLLRILRERDFPKSRFSKYIFFQNLPDFREILSVRRVLFFDCILINGSSLLRRRSYVRFCENKKKRLKALLILRMGRQLLTLQISMQYLLTNFCAPRRTGSGDIHDTGCALFIDLG